MNEIEETKKSVSAQKAEEERGTSEEGTKETRLTIYNSDDDSGSI